eukprot:g36229.t1
MADNNLMQIDSSAQSVRGEQYDAVSPPPGRLNSSSNLKPTATSHRKVRSDFSWIQNGKEAGPGVAVAAATSAPAAPANLAPVPSLVNYGRASTAPTINSTSSTSSSSTSTTTSSTTSSTPSSSDPAHAKRAWQSKRSMSESSFNFGDKRPPNRAPPPIPILDGSASHRSGQQPHSAGPWSKTDLMRAKSDGPPRSQSSHDVLLEEDPLTPNGSTSPERTPPHTANFNLTISSDNGVNDSFGSVGSSPKSTSSSPKGSSFCALCKRPCKATVLVVSGTSSPPAPPRCECGHDPAHHQTYSNGPLSPSSFSSSTSTSAKQHTRGTRSQDMSSTRRASVLAIIQDARGRQVQRRLRALSSNNLDVNRDSCIPLPRGGTYIKTKCGPVQVGLPPETIKDCMSLGLTLPTHYVLPKERFNMEVGINVAEFEFPAYFNFFIKRTKINLIIDRHVEPFIRQIFQESLLGPKEIQWPKEYSEKIPRDAYPDLAAELASFRKNPFNPKEELSVDVLIIFTYFDEETGLATLPEGVQIRYNESESNYEFLQDGVVTSKCFGHVLPTAPSSFTSFHPVPIAPPPDKAPSQTAASAPASLGSSPLSSPRGQPSSLSQLPPGPPREPASPTSSTTSSFVPPIFGVTMLGSSDGFDAKGTTTGFVLWMNRRGLMVDPPPHSGSWLRLHGINPRLMRGVILTHCHADHDAGTFQKILEEGRVVVMTTQIIMDSFLRKYSAVSGRPVEWLRKLFLFRPMIVGEEHSVFGGELSFFYSLHSIPCVGFSAMCAGRRFAYSADTFNDKEGINKFFADGRMSEQRRDLLLNFHGNWGADLILHEAGVPPIHTPLKTLESLPEVVRQRLYIVHKPGRDVPLDKGLKPTKVGPENTLLIPVARSTHFKAMEVLDLVGGIEFLSSLSVSRATEFLSAARSRRFQQGDRVIKAGTEGSSLYVIAMGSVSVVVDGKKVKSLTVGDHFGEMSLVMGGVRTADIIADTELELLVFQKHDITHIVRGTDALDKLRALSIKNRTGLAYQTLECNSALSQLTSSQKQALQLMMVRRFVKEGETIWNAGEPACEAVLVENGEFMFAGAVDAADSFKRGALVGEFTALLSASPVFTTLVCTAEGSFYSLDRSQLLHFFQDNPGVEVAFLNHKFIE